MAAFVALMAVVGAAAPAAVAASSPPATPHNYYGTVTDANGDVVSGVTVTVTQGDYQTTATTGDDGSYSVNVDTAEVNTDGTVTISVQGESKEREVDRGGTTKVDFSVDATSTPGGGDGTSTPGMPTPGTPTATPGGGNNGNTGNTGSTGGGGGGGGGAAPGQSVVSGSGSVAADGRASVDLSGGKAVESVEIRLPVGTTGDVSVDELEDLPADVSETRGKRIALLDVHAPDPGDGTAVVRLSVSKHVVDAYRASPEELTVEHYDADAGEWETLDTSVASTSGGKVVLEAETSGFSLYAVTQGDAESATTTTATTPEESTTAPPTATATPEESTDEPTTDEPTTTTRPFPGFGPVVALVALLVVALLARRRE